MEVSRIGANTPHRLHTVVRLVPKLRNPKREDILNIVQPPKLVGKNSQGKVDQTSASGLLNVALSLELLNKDDSDQSYRLHESLQDRRIYIDDLNEFRLIMQERITNPKSEHNPRLRRVTAWYAVQDERVFSYASKYELAKDYADKINERDFTEEEYGFNDTQYNGWLQWVEFLGWGWKMNLGIDRLVPNCAVRLRPLLPKLLPNLNKELTMNEFMINIATQCVELDGGIEYERCWAESRPNERRSNRLSLMLSSGLRTLERWGEIELLTYDDSPDSWRLYPKEASPEVVTHIKRIKGARK